MSSETNQYAIEMSSRHGDGGEGKAAVGIPVDSPPWGSSYFMREPIPRLPVPDVTLATEVLRLRGGPCWTMSYARLRPTMLASSHPETTHVFCVDHCTDGGRWILAASHQTTHEQMVNERAPMKLSLIHI